jgi:hypothetical protein
LLWFTVMSEQPQGSSNRFIRVAEIIEQYAGKNNATSRDFINAAHAIGREGLLVPLWGDPARRRMDLVEGDLVERLRAWGKHEAMFEFEQRMVEEAADEIEMLRRCGVAGFPRLSVDCDDGQVTVAWPDGRPRWASVTPEALECMIEQINELRRIKAPV